MRIFRKNNVLLLFLFSFPFLLLSFLLSLLFLHSQNCVFGGFFSLSFFFTPLSDSLKLRRIKCSEVIDVQFSLTFLIPAHRPPTNLREMTLLSIFHPLLKDLSSQLDSLKVTDHHHQHHHHHHSCFVPSINNNTASSDCFVLSFENKRTKWISSSTCCEARPSFPIDPMGEVFSHR